jgi:hypothetical protein
MYFSLSSLEATIHFLSLFFLSLNPTSKTFKNLDE